MSLKHLLKTHIFKQDEEHSVMPDNDYVITVIFMYRHSIELDLKFLYLERVS